MSGLTAPSAVHLLEVNWMNDLISREAAIRALVSAGTKEPNAEKGLLILSGIAVAIDVIEKVPDVKIERKAAEWIHVMEEHGPMYSGEDYEWFTCSRCRHDIARRMPVKKSSLPNYCQHCGAYMGGEQDETD